jgi:hypothetical protein
MHARGVYVYTVSARNPEGKRQLRRHKPRQNDNIKVDVKEIESGYGLD